MLVTSPNLTALRTGYRTLFQDALNAMLAMSMYKRIAMVVKSTAVRETYGWLKDDAKMRQWVGPRQINALSENGQVIENLPFEYTVGVKRPDIELDNLSTYPQRFSNMGRAAAQQPDLLVWAALKAGFTTNCFDGQPFFSTSHPIVANDGTVTTYANTDGGAGQPWFLVDTTKLMLPIIYQEAIPPRFVNVDQPDDQHVFVNNELLYGVDMMCNAGFGLPSLAWGSKQPLTAANVKIAFETMEQYKGEGGQPLGISPVICFVHPTYRQAAADIFKAKTTGGGNSNPWEGAVEVVVVPWLT
jgi:phage major head subunit gpT-like protein